MREYDLTNARWRKSSYSGGDGGEACVEVADEVPGVVPVRDSKVPHGPVVVIGSAAWTDFVGTVGAARFFASVVLPRAE
ncbi:DUF397 domain-containing protein [Streptomyces sp. PSKA30]|uniref:DUF397 domain-containing protein n=1 Tax=Streptomyces sp. PSKA30 TaxID=2874597 RepID=UPI001CD1348F|nr:DUF397 domain-containing protein [Streptomyces sp. PSKA30]MBZ9643673.1 DUF397 domain-containing protein [Streptomyces sp. PSKA30]